MKGRRQEGNLEQIGEGSIWIWRYVRGKLLSLDWGKEELGGGGGGWLINSLRQPLILTEWEGAGGFS